MFCSLPEAACPVEDLSNGCAMLRWTQLQPAGQQCSGGLPLGQRRPPCREAPPSLLLSLMRAIRSCRKPCPLCRSGLCPSCSSVSA